MKKKLGLKGKKSLAVVFAALLIALLATGCSDEDYDYEEDSYEESSDGAYEEASDESYSSSDRDLASEYDYPHGTADKLEGKIVVVSIFLNDNTTSWDFDSEKDKNTVIALSRNMSLGMNWITEQGKKYGKDIEFIYDWDNDNDLFYLIDIDCDFSQGGANNQEVKTLLDENFKEVSYKLLSKYGAENIIYAMYLNENSDTNMTCHAMPFNGTELGYDMPYEPVCLTNWVYGAEQGPATSAHEILHIFGAPDYYTVDEIGNNFGMTQEFVDYCASTDMVNEIMCSTYDPYTNTIPKDKVTNDLSDLTAYYVGWIDSCELVDEFGLGTSQHAQ